MEELKRMVEVLRRIAEDLRAEGEEHAHDEYVARDAREKASRRAMAAEQAIEELQYLIDGSTDRRENP